MGDCLAATGLDMALEPNELTTRINEAAHQSMVRFVRPQLLGKPFQSPSFWKAVAQLIDGEPLREQRPVCLQFEIVGQSRRDVPQNAFNLDLTRNADHC